MLAIVLAPLETYFQANNLLGIIVAFFAAVIGAILGALLLGLITQLTTRILTMKKAPRTFTAFMRVIGAGIGGVCVFLYVLTYFGGPGMGGPGGMGFGTGIGKGTGETEKDAKKDKGKSGETPETSQTVYVEVLMNDENQTHRRRVRHRLTKVTTASKGTTNAT